MGDKLILPVSHRRRLLSSLMCSHSDASGSSENFKLKSTKEFASRSKNVFQELKTLEKEHESRISDHETHEQFEKLDCPNVIEAPSNVLKKLDHCKIIEASTDVFKKPFHPLPRKKKCMFNSVPGFKKHPQKWTKYSLADTPDVSDESNTAAAMQFLDEMRNRQKEIDSNSDVLAKKMVFFKPQLENVIENLKPSHSVETVFVKPTKHVMPDYIVGRGKLSKQPSKAKVTNKVMNVQNVRLDHLDEDICDAI